MILTGLAYLAGGLVVGAVGAWLSDGAIEWEDDDDDDDCRDDDDDEMSAWEKEELDDELLNRD